MSSTFKVFVNRRMLAILALGFSSGMPLALVGGTLQAWMASEKVDLTVIGIFSLVGLPFTLKFLWAPFLDRYVPPFLGRRRGWILISQIGLIFALIGMAFSNPVQAPGLLAVLAFLVAFSSATQDIVIDAYRTEVLLPNEYGVGSAVTTLGYRLAMIFSGAFALILADHIPFKSVYLLMAGAMSLGVLASITAPEPSSNARPPKTLGEAIIDPLVDFFKRKGVGELVAFIIIYKLDVVVTMALMTPFMLELGFTKTDIGAVSKGAGLVATLFGTFLGGAYLAKIGIQKSLWIFGLLQGFSGFCFFMLAKLGHSYPMMVTAIVAENFFSGMGNAAYAAFLMSLCNPKFTATQFALLTSLMALTRTLAGAPTGWLAKTVGWEAYYIIAMLLAIPGFILLSRYRNWAVLGTVRDRVSS